MSIYEAGLLKEVISTTAFRNTEDLKVARLLGKKMMSHLGRRSWDLPSDAGFSSYPGRDMYHTFVKKAKLEALFGLDSRLILQKEFRWFDEKVAKNHLRGIEAFYGYEDTSATTFEAAKRKGMKCLYDLPIMYHQTSRRILTEEAELFPEFKNSLSAAVEPQWRIDRKEQELELADHIFVASTITNNSLLEIGVPQDRITVIPYGSPCEYYKVYKKKDTTFRAMFAGLNGARKGIHYLMRAWKELKLKDSELMLVGGVQFPEDWFRKNLDGINYIQNVPHKLLNRYYCQASVFVFPSLVEGFGMVLLEAMACGLPIIATPNTAGPDLIEDGKEGFIIPIRDVEALKEKLEWCSENPEALREMGKAARRKAKQLTWQKYRDELGARITSIMSHSKV